MSALLTGIGAVLPVGTAAAACREALRAGARAVSRRPELALAGGPAPWAAPVPVEDASSLVPDADLRRASRLSCFAVAAAVEALASAAFRARAEAPALLVALTHGSTAHFAGFHRDLLAGTEPASPTLFSTGVLNAPAAHVGLHLGLQGPTRTLLGGEEVGLAACALAADAAESRGAALVIGASEVTAELLAGYRAFGRLAAPESDEASVPFGA
ncbi:MAG: beta-ketoacyl synthase chain length factor, partial [Planctomycetales bacterium]|nr:beta-ketoacyl synthase chain length factor [Planctomycetales bacterium]